MNIKSSLSNVMQYKQLFLLAFAFIVGTASFAAAQDEKDLHKQPIQLLEQGAFFYGYPGTMAFHTAFHAGVTTRYMLLKATTQLPELRDYLALDATQLKTLAKLPLLDIETILANVPKALTDRNAEPDEQIVKPDYYDFLSSNQFSKLDRVAFEFDGFSALTRRSVARRLEITEETSLAISAIVKRNREDYFLPYFRWRFAAPLPPDNEYQKCEFSGKYLLQLNREIIKTLSLKEAQNIVSWLSVDPPTTKMIEEIKRLAPMPSGLFGLFENDNDGQNDALVPSTPTTLNPRSP